MSDGKPGRPARKKDRYNRFAWRDAVFADPKTPTNAKCLAFAIAKHVNRETGEAFPSTVTCVTTASMLRRTCMSREHRADMPCRRSNGIASVEFEKSRYPEGSRSRVPGTYTPLSKDPRNRWGAHKKKGRLRCHRRPKSREETPKEGSDSGGATAYPS